MRVLFRHLRLLLLGVPALLACATAAPPAAAPAATAAAPAPSATAPPPAAATAPAVPPAVAAPVARRVPHPTTIHGRTLPDDYFWMRNKGTPEVESYLRAENDYTAAFMKPTAALQKTLYDEMLARLKETDASVPYRDHGYYYYDRTVQGAQYTILCRKSARGAAADDLTGASAPAPEQVMLDLNEIGRTEKFVGLGPHTVSDDGNLFAYALDTTGFRQYTLHIKDLTGKRTFDEAIPRVDNVEWSSDGRTVFYVVEDPVAKRAYRLYRHSVGSDAAKDLLVYEEKDELFELGLTRSRDGAYLILNSESKTTTEQRVLRRDRPTGAWAVVEPRQHDVRYYVEHRGDRFYVRTDAPAADGKKARNFRLATAPVATPGRAHWKELVPHREDVMLEDFDVFADYLVLTERADALPRLRVLSLTKPATPADEVKMPEAIYAVFPDYNPEFASTSFRFHFQSPVTPDSVYDYDLRKHALTLRKRREVLGGYDPSRYTSARLHATAADGRSVPISIIYRKDLTPASPHPMLLYAYGSYGIPLAVTFSSARVSLLDRGVVYAFAHIRGGGDLGKRWHEEARMGSKMNTFTDFIACAETLIHDGWTRNDRLIIQGGSAGGLLMGAVANLRPDLWKAVVAQVPFVDVINTMLDETLPLTVGEFEEWGNPKHKDEFDVMIRYSPYDNVTAKPYPAMLVMTSYNDSQVGYWEPAKWVARLRATKTDHNPLLLKTNMDPAGHGGFSGRYDQIRDTAFVYAFVLTELGLH